jgi:hypothetical protein
MSDKKRNDLLDEGRQLMTSARSWIITKRFERTWTSKDGKFARRAIFGSIMGTNVVIRVTGVDEDTTVPISALSKRDQDFLAP